MRTEKQHPFAGKLRPRPGDDMYGVTRHAYKGHKPGWFVRLAWMEGNVPAFACKIFDSAHGDDCERSLLRAITLRDENLNLVEPDAREGRKLAPIRRVYRIIESRCWAVSYTNTLGIFGSIWFKDEDLGGPYESFKAAVTARRQKEWQMHGEHELTLEEALAKYSEYKVKH